MKKTELQHKDNKSGGKEYVEDITKLSKPRLLELLDRQKKLLDNRRTLECLPDKGIRVKQIKKQIEDELAKRGDNLCEVLEGLTLSTPQVNALEWTKNANLLKKGAIKEERKDSEGNPFKILANHSGTVFSKKTIRVEEQEDPLITEKDIEEIYAMKLCSKIDNVEPSAKFLPHRTLNHTYSSRKSPSDYNPQDVCSASQPPSKFGSVKPISLETSIKLQFEQIHYLKEVQLKHAAERLKDKSYKIGNVLPSKEKLLIYRDPASLNSDSDYEDEVEEEEVQEVEDECAGEDRKGTVTYSISD